MNEKTGTKDGNAPVRGLEGVVAAETTISYVDGVHGRLYYQGYDIHALAEQVSFCEVVFLLWNGRLPTLAEHEQIAVELRKDMVVPEQVRELLRATPPESHPMAVLRSAISLLGTIDPDADDVSPAANRRKAPRVLAQTAAIVADLHRTRSGQPVLSPDPALNFAGNFIYMLRGTPPDEVEQRALDLLLVLHADHGMNASTFTSRVISSTLGDMHGALTGALGALKGPLHGGANQRVMEMVLEIGDVNTVQEYIEGMLENRQRIMGFGHRVYRTEDPRAKHLRKYSELLCERKGQTHLYEISRRIEHIVREQKGIYPNVDFYSATLQHALGIPPEYFTAVFAVSRTAGWVAHVMEQYADNRLIRPTSKYLGELGLPFKPIAERGADD